MKPKICSYTCFDLRKNSRTGKCILRGCKVLPSIYHWSKVLGDIYIRYIFRRKDKVYTKVGNFDEIGFHFGFQNLKNDEILKVRNFQKYIIFQVLNSKSKPNFIKVAYLKVYLVFFSFPLRISLMSQYFRTS